MLSVLSLRLVDRLARYELAELGRASEGTPWYYEARMNRALEARVLHAARSVGREALLDPARTQEALRKAGLSLFDVLTLDPPLAALQKTVAPDTLLATSAESALVLADADGQPIGTLRYRYSEEGVKTVLRECLRDHSAPWNDDSVQIFLGGNPKGRFREGFDLNLIVRIDDDSLRERQGRTGDIRFASRRTGDGFSVEVAIPWRHVGVAPAPGAELRFDITNNDRDLPHGPRNGQRTWSGYGRNWADPSALGTMRLALNAEKSVSGEAVALPVRTPVDVDGRLAEPDWALTNEATKVEGQTDNVVHWGALWSPSELLVGVRVRDPVTMNNWSREDTGWILRLADPQGHPLLDSSPDVPSVLARLAAADARQVIGLGPLKGDHIVFAYRERRVSQQIERWKIGAAGLVAGANVIFAIGLWLVFASVRHEMHLAALKSHFVATVSHEFKAPLALLQASAETLRGGRVLDDDKRRRYQEIIESESRRLASLVDNVLSVSRIEAGRQYHLAPTQLASVVESALRLHRLTLEREGFDVEVSVPKDLKAVEADAGALQEALSNLVDNAIRYSRERKSCRIEVVSAKGSVEVSVSDRGLGVAPADRERVFERFYRGEKEGHGEKGVGLGLSIARAIARAHGGDIRLEGLSGGGSRFTLVLPIRGPAA